MSVRKFNRSRKRKFSRAWLTVPMKKFKRDLRQSMKKMKGDVIPFSDLKEKFRQLAHHHYDRTIAPIFLKRDKRMFKEIIKVKRHPDDENRMLVSISKRKKLFV